ncbi:MAG TPA: hypothetical protein VE690_15920 [Rhodopila sp.]|nr:hypothetical protein [Rhodopila sp.]
MRMIFAPFCAALLAGCGLTETAIATLTVTANAGSIAAIQRSPPDALFSLLTGQDCSVVRLDQGKGYCRPVEPPPEPPPFCTRSLGVVDCWQDPSRLPGYYTGVADGPMALTAAQEANRTRTWP